MELNLSRSEKSLRILLEHSRRHRKADAHCVLMMSMKPSVPAIANISEALHLHGSPIGTLNALLYWTRRSLNACRVYETHGLHVTVSFEKRIVLNGQRSTLPFYIEIRGDLMTQIFEFRHPGQSYTAE